MAADALARLKRKETELEEAKKQYHEILVDRDARIEELEKTLKSVRGDLSTTRKVKEDLAREVNGYKDTARDATATKTKLEKDLKFQTGIADYDREVAEKLTKEAAETSKKIKTQDEIVRLLKDRVSTNAATIQELNKKVDDLEGQKETLQAANSNLALQHEGTTSEVSHATQEFEHMFQDLGRELDLNGYVGHVRDLLSTGQLKRQDSSLSLQRQLSPQKSYQELPNIAGSSLQDQLAAADDTSSEQSAPAPADADDEDDTLTDLGLGRQWTEYDYFVRLQDQEKKIAELKRLNEELLAKTQTDDATTTTDNTTQTDVDDATITTTDNATQTDTNDTRVATPPSPVLGFSTIQSVDTNPVKPKAIQPVPTKPVKSKSIHKKAEERDRELEAVLATDPLNLDFSTIQSVETTPLRPTRRKIRYPIKLVQPPTVSEVWQRLPFSIKLIFFMLLTLYLFLFAGLMGERYMWSSTNDLTRQTVVRMGGGGMAGLFAPMLTAADDMLGADTAMLG
jgi:hypothetical protein